MTGSVGSKPTFGFTGTAVFDTGSVTSTSSQTVTINPPVGGTKVLAVVANPTTLSAADKKVERLRRGQLHDHLRRRRHRAGGRRAADYSFVVLYPSVVEAKLGTRLRDLERPVMVLHSRMLDEMGMAATGGDGSVTATTADVVKPMHPLSTALSGTAGDQHRPQPRPATAYPRAAAEVITQVAGRRPTEFAYHKGAAMAVGQRRRPAGCSSARNTPTQLNTTAWTMFNRAAAYTSMDCGKNMLWTAAGNGGTTYGGGDGGQSVAGGSTRPWGLAIDGQDRVYVADAALHAVRRINTDGTVTTVAGTGTSGVDRRRRAGHGGAAERPGAAGVRRRRATCSSPTRATTGSAR